MRGASRSHCRSSRPRWRRRKGIACFLVSVALLEPGDATAQAVGDTACLVALLKSLRQYDTGGGHYFGGDFDVSCGDARMQSDSSLLIEVTGQLSRADLWGRVRYRDSTRSLTSDSLTYFGDADRVVAMGEVVLHARRSGAILRGPVVEFNRLTRSGADRTIATGRPHLDVERGADGDRPPMSVDADRIELIREDTARSWGDVVITREDVMASSDSAVFDLVDDHGVLHGEAHAAGEDFNLTGDSIRVEFEGEDLRAVQAFGGANASGRDFDIRSTEIRASLLDGAIEEVWAFGGRSAAISGGYHLVADSLRFRLSGGAIDSAYATGDAAAQEDSAAVVSTAEPDLSVAGDRAWMAGDTLVAAFEVPGDSSAARVAPEDTVDAARVSPAETATEEDAEAAPGGEAAGATGDRKIRELRASGNARAFYVAADTAEGGGGGRNYVRGQTITVSFETGRARRVAATQAIGLFLDPTAEGAAVRAEDGGEETAEEGAEPEAGPRRRGGGLGEAGARPPPPGEQAAPPGEQAAPPADEAVPPDSAAGDDSDTGDDP